MKLNRLPGVYSFGMKLALGMVLAVSAGSFVQSRSPVGEYALILEDAPIAQKSHSRAELAGAEAHRQWQRIRAAQAAVLGELKRRKVGVEWAGQVLANAIYVRTTRAVAVELGDIEGVAHVVYLPPIKRDLTTALDLMNIPAAQNAVGGAANAGAGIKIGIIDSGIDQNHPGFQDASLQPPAGFPKGDTNYTNNKVIVARSYVALDSDPDPQYSSPDDTSPRDRMGHGTAIAMIAAGVRNTGPLGTIQGVAPKAFLGNYKVFGSPGVNDYAHYAAVQHALEDAVADGMDVVTLSLNEGSTIAVGPLDTGAACGAANGSPCDPYATFVENASAAGLTVVTSAGNDGNIGLQPATLNTIHTPGTAPSAITVGASTNAHALYQAVHVAKAPASLQNIRALMGDGPHIDSALGALVVDVAQLGNDGLACAALPAGSVAQSIALVQRGTCQFADKIVNAENAGAIAVIIYQSAGNDAIFNSLFAQNTGIPAAMIGNTDGVALKAFVDANPGAAATLDPVFNAAAVQSNMVAAYSSRGPSIGNFANPPALAIKPELIATGDNIYTATQRLDPAGDGYHASGYTAVSGTSYAVPMVAGVAALAKQKNSGLNTPGKLKSAVVNTASSDVADAAATPARVSAAGAGKLKADDAINAAATLEPATLSFGALFTANVSSRLTLNVTNVSASTATFNFAVQPRDASIATVAVAPASLTLAPGARNSVSVSLTSTLRPAPGSYEGAIAVTGAGPAMHVPYQYLAGSGVPADIFPIFNGSFTGGTGDVQWKIGFRVVDQYGVPVTNSPVIFQAAQGGGKIDPQLGADTRTDLFGDAGAWVDLGANPGDQVFTATAGGLGITFYGYARNYPAISAGGVVDAATNQAGNGLAPGSYISIYGFALADVKAAYTTAFLPVALSSVAVSFDAPGISVPGHIHFVSPVQVNVQVPWELQGQKQAQLKVTVRDFLSSVLYTVPLATYSPGIFGVVDFQTGAVAAARRGDTIEIFCNGLGPVSNTPPSGEVTPPQPLAQTSVPPTVSIGGAPAQVIFSGLAPGFVGLYQVNATLPPDAPSGNQPLVVTIGGVSSKPVTVAVQ